MINPNELRIGSLVETHEGIHKVKGVQDIDGSKATVLFENAHSCDARICFAIPLSSEWMERCGFKEDGGNDWAGPEIENDDSIEVFTIKKKSTGYFFFGSEWTHGKPFHYLHQLQNIFLDLTGEELTIKETV